MQSSGYFTAPTVTFVTQLIFERTNKQKLPNLQKDINLTEIGYFRLSGV